MPTTCCVEGCRVRFQKGCGVSFNCFPRDEVLKARWVQAAKQSPNWCPRLDSRICGQHFQSGKPSKDPLHPDYVPNVFTSLKKKFPRYFVEKRPLANENHIVSIVTETRVDTEPKRLKITVNKPEAKSNTEPFETHFVKSEPNYPETPAASTTSNHNPAEQAASSSDYFLGYCVPSLDDFGLLPRISIPPSQAYNEPEVLLMENLCDNDDPGNDSDMDPLRFKVEPMDFPELPEEDEGTPHGPDLPTVHDLLQQIREFKKEKELLTTQLNTAHQQISTADVKLRQFEEEKVKLTTQLNDARLRIRELERQKVILVSQLTSRQEIDIATQQIRELEEQKSVLTSELNTARLQVNTARQQVLLLQGYREKDAEELVSLRKGASLDCLTSEPDRCHYYTGLPNADKFNEVLQVAESTKKIAKLSAYFQLLLVLIKLKLNLELEDIAFRFNIHRSTVTRVYDHNLPEISKILDKYIVWLNDINPLPLCFNIPKYKNTVAIVDTFEILVRKRSPTYKEDVLKFIIIFAANGKVMHLSECDYNDMDIELGTYFTGHIKPGDIILADKEFDGSSINSLGGQLMCPPFSDSTYKLSDTEKINGRKRLDVHAFVKKVVGQIKHFRVLTSGVLTDRTVQQAKDIVHICAALINFNPPFEV